MAHEADMAVDGRTGAVRRPAGDMVAGTGVVNWPLIAVLIADAAVWWGIIWCLT